ncbi:DUF2269 family protein [Legionella jamestowniensis]|uniref:Integral membrane protein n=1 Tax=Legionella jamestowniensis TaxID=455 RepID=A0A0W0UJA8_9GAMM|nr:DUF2269 domain-containing protein [Legionella jamestowniensis]KTD07946.1 integral membrane protein [Legionella jamestowniensis]OCH99079.1 hypothetical protein A8135_10075 [Legionella jamestowniensis]SFL64481.1 Uncharacterized membrane protein [Legionella jamestowniensis DSM 19215]
MLYLWLKLIHIISSTLLFGTGLGSAFYMFMANLKRDNLLHLQRTTRNVVIADFIFTTPAVIIQPLTGLLMVYLAAFPLTSFWILASLLLYLLVGLCWIPVVFIQIKLEKLISIAITNQQELPSDYYRLYRIWFILGWPAFIGVLLIFYLMVIKIV